MRFLRGLSVFCVLTWLFALLGGNLFGQQVFGSIFGRVTDPSGAPVNNAKITIVDVEKGGSFDATTNAFGIFVRNDLIPDRYTVTIEAPGFQKVVSNELPVHVDEATQFNAALQAGSGSAPPGGDASALQTDRADLAQILTSQEISQLPSDSALNDRNLQNFAWLNPGSIRWSSTLTSALDPQGSTWDFVNGLPWYMGGSDLDGADNQDVLYGILIINPTFDSVHEVKQANEDFDVEFGSFAAGLFNYSTKSGTNSFHASGFEYLGVNTPGFQDFGRNPFTENTPIVTGPHSVNAGAYVPTTHQNQFGGSLGGKIIKDKLFYFADAQLTREHLGGSVLTTVPTAQDRTGNLSDWLALGPQYQIYCPQNSTTNVGRAVPGNILNTGFCGTLPGTAAGTFLSPQAQALLNYFPLPNTGAGLPYDNYEATGTSTVAGNQWDTRWDYYQNAKNTFFGRYSYAGYSIQAPGAFGDLAGGPSFSTGFAGSSQILNQSLSAGWTYTKSAATVNEFRWGYVRYHVNEQPNGFGTSPATAAGIPNLNTSLSTSGLPAIVIQGPLALTPLVSSPEFALGYSLAVNDCNCPLTDFERQWQVVDNFSHIMGKHSFKIGRASCRERV